MVAGIAQAALPQNVVAQGIWWKVMIAFCNDIGLLLPGFADYNQRIRHPGGFHLINAAAEGAG